MAGRPRRCPERPPRPSGKREVGRRSDASRVDLARRRRTDPPQRFRRARTGFSAGRGAPRVQAARGSGLSETILRRIRHVRSEFGNKNDIQCNSLKIRSVLFWRQCASTVASICWVGLVSSRSGRPRGGSLWLGSPRAARRRAPPGNRRRPATAPPAGHCPPPGTVDPAPASRPPRRMGTVPPGMGTPTPPEAGRPTGHRRRPARRWACRPPVVMPAPSTRRPVPPTPPPPSAAITFDPPGGNFLGNQAVKLVAGRARHGHPLHHRRLAADRHLARSTARRSC